MRKPTCLKVLTSSGWSGQVAEQPAHFLADDMLGAVAQQFLPDGRMTLGGVKRRGKKGYVGFVGAGAQVQLDQPFTSQAMLLLTQNVGERTVTIPGKAGVQCSSHRRYRF